MNALVDDGDLRIYVGDALETLRQLPDESVHCVATSPPFYGLRDYGTGQWEGGDPDCDHIANRTGVHRNHSGDIRRKPKHDEEQAYTSITYQYREACGKCDARRVDGQIGLEQSPEEWAARLVEVFREARRVLRQDGTLWVECGDSYAANTQGSPPTGDETARGKLGTEVNAWSGRSQTDVENPYGPKNLMLMPMLLAVALRADGWVLRGAYVWEKPDAMPESVTDRCTVSHSYVFHFARSSRATFWTHRDGKGARRQPAPDYRWIDPETKAESAEPVDGWRRVNLWRGRDYYFDREAILEPFSDYSNTGGGRQRAAARGDDRYTSAEFKSYDPGRSDRFSGTGGVPRRKGSGNLHPKGSSDVGKPSGDVGRSIPWNYPAEESAQLDLEGNEAEPEARGPDGRLAIMHAGAGPGGHENYSNRGGNSRWPSLEGRSPRSVWRIPTEASSFGLCPRCRTYWDRGAPAQHCGGPVVAHFAVWPHELVRRIIACSTSEAGCCADCGAPYARAATREFVVDHEYERGRNARRDGVDDGTRRPETALALGRSRVGSYAVETTGWHPTCDCDAPIVPCTVLDPFGGSATTARQARLMGRASIIVELSADYAAIAAHRTAQLGLLTS